MEPGTTPAETNRRTRRRAALLAALDECPDFISAQALHARIAHEPFSISLTTVYRKLRELEIDGTLDVVRDERGERLYRRRAAVGHRHYLICRSCGRSEPVDSDAVEEWAERIGPSMGFTDVEHTVELTGICTQCTRRVVIGWE